RRVCVGPIDRTSVLIASLTSITSLLGPHCRHPAPGSPAFHHSGPGAASEPRSEELAPSGNRVQPAVPVARLPLLDPDERLPDLPRDRRVRRQRHLATAPRQ